MMRSPMMLAVAMCAAAMPSAGSQMPRRAPMRDPMRERAERVVIPPSRYGGGGRNLAALVHLAKKNARRRK